MSITDRVNRPFAGETLLTTPESLHAERDQCHAAARSGVCPAHHLHDHNTLARKQHEPGDPIQWGEESSDQQVAGANSFHRSRRHDPV